MSLEVDLTAPVTEAIRGLEEAKEAMDNFEKMRKGVAASDSVAKEETSAAAAAAERLIKEKLDAASSKMRGVLAVMQQQVTGSAAMRLPLRARTSGRITSRVWAW